MRFRTQQINSTSVTLCSQGKGDEGEHRPRGSEKPGICGRLAERGTVTKELNPLSLDKKSIDLKRRSADQLMHIACGDMWGIRLLTPKLSWIWMDMVQKSQRAPNGMCFSC